MSDGKIVKFIRDGWENVMKGFGSSRDPNKSTTCGDCELLSDTSLASMYAGDGWQKKVASVPAGTMTREWVSISDDADSKIKKLLESLDSQNLFKQALTWQRVFRGGLIWMVSSQSPKAEYKAGKKIDIKKLLVFSAAEVRIHEMYGATVGVTAGNNTTNVAIDPLRIGEVKTFKILKNEKRSEDIIVDATQCLEFKGDPLPSVPEEQFESLLVNGSVEVIEYLYWGIGALQSIYPQMSKYGIFEGAMGKIATELVVGIYKIAGLREILNSDGGPELIKRRIEAMDLAKSTINALFMDAEAGEDFLRNTINLAGVPDLWDRFMMTASGVSNIPASKLFGRQASGMNNKGEQDERNYNDYIVDEQNKDMRKNISILLGFLTGESVEFTFNNPWAPSQAELVEMKKKQAETDKVYLDGQVISPNEVRQSRFEGAYSFETELINELPPEKQEGDKNLPPGPGEGKK
jgi:hypothetical protein